MNRKVIQKLSVADINRNTSQYLTQHGRRNQSSLGLPVETDRFGSQGATSRRMRESEFEDEEYERLSHKSVQNRFVSLRPNF